MNSADNNETNWNVLTMLCIRIAITSLRHSTEKLGETLQLVLDMV